MRAARLFQKLKLVVQVLRRGLASCFDRSGGARIGMAFGTPERPLPASRVLGWAASVKTSPTTEDLSVSEWVQGDRFRVRDYSSEMRNGRGTSTDRALYDHVNGT